jgi:hypothetical protein
MTDDRSRISTPYMRYTVVCLGLTRWDENVVKSMRSAKMGDKRLHSPRGWETDVFPTRCPECGDPAQQRGVYKVVPFG